MEKNSATGIQRFISENGRRNHRDRRGHRNQRNHRGFSLVELIVVVAIMAVLVGVLAPQYLRYVEKTRLQRDNSAIAEIAEAVKIALTEESVYEATGGNVQLVSSGDRFIFQNADGTYPYPYAICEELSKNFGEEYVFSSKTYQEQTLAVCIIVSPGTVLNGYGRVSGETEVQIIGWVENVGDTPTYGTEANPAKLL